MSTPIRLLKSLRQVANQQEQAHPSSSNAANGLPDGSQRQGTRRPTGQVQHQYVAVESVLGEMLVLAPARSGRRFGETPHEYRAILEVASTNFALKGEAEQEALLAGYRAFLSGLSFPLQIVVSVRPLDLRPYCIQLAAAATAVSPPPANTDHPHQAVSPQSPTTDGSHHSEPLFTVWQQLARDEERYLRDLAARKTLLDRRFFVVIPCDVSEAHSGQGSRWPNAATRPLSHRGRRARGQVRQASLTAAGQQLAVRARAVQRELERIGLDARRLAGADLVGAYARVLGASFSADENASAQAIAGIPVPIAHLPEATTTSETAEPLGQPSEGHAAVVAVENPIADAAIASDNTPEAPTPRNSAEEVHGGPAQPNPLSDESGADPAKAATRHASRFRWPRRQSLVDAARALDISTIGDLADLLAPASVTLTAHDIQLDETYAHTLAVVNYPRHVYPGWLERLIDLDEPLDLVLHLHPQSSAAMIRQLSHRLVQLHSSRLLSEHQGRMAQPDVAIAYTDVERLRDRLQRGDERVFAVSLYVHVRATASLPPDPPRLALEERIARVRTALDNQQLLAHSTTFEHDLGFLSCLPEARDRLLRTRLLDTSSVTTAFPFCSNGLSMPEGILYGTTAMGSPVFLDVFSHDLENANMVIFAKSGAGKSYAGKVQALRHLLRGTDVYVVDPEDEYQALAGAVGGQVVRLAAGSSEHLNPFDLPPVPPSDADDASSGNAHRNAQDALADKVQALHALLDLLLADRGPQGATTLSTREKGLLDRALYETYRRVGITADPTTHFRPAPLLRDLYDVLAAGSCGMDDTHLAERLHRYAYGSLSRLFAEPTNVALGNRLVVFNVRDMDAELRPLGLFLIADFVWTRIREQRHPRLLLIDEAWTLMQYPEGGRFLAGLARRARKYYLGLITITQDAQDFLASEHGRTVLANSSVQLLMKQDASTIDVVSQTFRLSHGDRQYLLGCHKGEGLLFARGGHVALQIEASPYEHELATTDPRELARLQTAREGVAQHHAIAAETAISRDSQTPSEGSDRRESPARPAADEQHRPAMATDEPMGRRSASRGRRPHVQPPTATPPPVQDAPSTPPAQAELPTGASARHGAVLSVATTAAVSNTERVEQPAIPEPARKQREAPQA